MTRLTADVRAMGNRRHRRTLGLVLLYAVLTGLLSLTTGTAYLPAWLGGGAVLLTGCALQGQERRSGTDGVLVISASMGAGHDGVAYELRRRILEAGGRADVVDYLTLMPLGTGRLMRRAYAAQLRYAPGSYEWLYDALERVPLLERSARMAAGWGRRALLRRILGGGYGLAIATYPLAGQALGQLRRREQLSVPAVTFLTDVDVHAMWLDAGTDLYLAVYEGSAQEARRRTGRSALAVGPVLPPCHASPVTPQERAIARARLGRRDEEPVVLLVTGSWGVGDVLPTVAAIAAAGFGSPMVLCGRNRQLLHEVSEQGVGIAVGWTGDVRSLLAAADAVIHNAGGLSSLEGFAAGVPVIGYACLPGHGERNARAMREAGVAALAESTEDLVRLLRQLVGTPAGRAMADRARTLFAVDPTPRLVTRSRRDSGQMSHRPPAARRRIARAGATLAGAMLVIGGLDLGISKASERYGFVARPASTPTHLMYVAALLDPSELADPRIVALLQQARVSAIVPAGTALPSPVALGRLAAANVSVLTTDQQGNDEAEVTARRAADLIGRIEAGTGQRRVPIVLMHRITPLQLLGYSHAHRLLGSPDVVVQPGSAVVLRKREQVVLDLRGIDIQRSVSLVASLRRQAATQGLSPRSWGAMWDLP